MSGNQCLLTRALAGMKESGLSVLAYELCTAGFIAAEEKISASRF